MVSGDQFSSCTKIYKNIEWRTKNRPGVSVDHIRENLSVYIHTRIVGKRRSWLGVAALPFVTVRAGFSCATLYFNIFGECTILMPQSIQRLSRWSGTFRIPCISVYWTIMDTLLIVLWFRQSFCKLYLISKMLHYITQLAREVVALSTQV